MRGRSTNRTATTKARRSPPADREIERIYKQISLGRKVIKALASIAAAGVNEKDLPKLAIMRADQAKCFLRISPSGEAIMSNDGNYYGRKRSDLRFRLPERTFPGRSYAQRQDFEALVPMIPPEHRPARGLANYHILFEAEWTRTPPIDPILLRRLGKGDVWLVCAAWDLTEVERAVLAGRL